MKKWRGMLLFLLLVVGCAPSMKDLPKLQAKLSDSKEKTRLSAVKDIGRIQDATPETLPVLYDILKNDQSAAVRAEAVKSIQKLGFAQASNVIAKVLKSDKDAQVRTKAAEALYALTGHNAYNNLSHSLNNDLSPTVRAACLKCIGIIGGEKALVQIREKLKNDPSPVVRAQAATSLGENKDVQSLDVLRDMAYKDPSPEVQKAAVIAIGFLPGDKAMRILCSALKSPALQDAAITAIHDNDRAIESRDAITNLMRIVDSSPEMIGDDRVIDIFLGCNDFRVRPYFRRYILYPYADRDKFEKIAQICISSGYTTMVPRLIGDLRSTNNSSVQINIATALGYFRDERATPTLLSCLRNRQNYKSHVPAHFIWALQAIRDPRAFDYLCQMCCNESDKELRRDACVASSEIWYSPINRLPECPCWNK